MKPIKPKKCRVCKEQFTPFKSTEAVCSLKCAITLAKEKTAKKEAKEWKERKRKLKAKHETYSQRLQKARRVFQRFIRLRDQNLPCVSCGSTTATCWNAGHYLKAELFPGLIFHEENCFRQCARCNLYLNGNEVQYRKVLISRIGEDRVKAIEAKADESRVRKYSREELEEIRQKYSMKCKELGL